MASKVTLYIIEFSSIRQEDRTFHIVSRMPKAIYWVKRFKTMSQCQDWYKTSEKTEHWRSTHGDNIFIHRVVTHHTKSRRKIRLKGMLSITGTKKMASDTTSSQETKK